MGMIFTNAVTSRQVKKQDASLEELQEKVATTQAIMASMLMAQASADEAEDDSEQA